MSDTIAAISTAPGEGGIGVVRISGPCSENIMRKLMKNCPEVIEPRHAYFGRVVSDSSDPASEVIDEAVFLYMKDPFSYTGENMLEIQGHGNNVSLRKILSAVLRSGFSDVRIADPGEFTKLAFLNGKMDLSQAEAVMDIIKAKTDLSLGIAEKQKEGRLSRSISIIREVLLNILAEMAVDIDYPDEDYDTVQNEYSHIIDRLKQSLSDVDALLSTASVGRIAREGVRAVIAGRPNAGKSSLMNAILGEGRVIVTDVPGTTRDTVEESATLGGIPIVLVDTAGLRDSDDKVEQIGIERTEIAIRDADIVIFVIDGSRELDDEDEQVLSLVEKTDTSHVLVVFNKQDLGKALNEETVLSRLSGARSITTSLVGSGADEAAVSVSSAVSEMLDFGITASSESNIVTSERHLQMLRNAASDLSDSIDMLRNGEPVEVAELSVHYAYDALGSIIGEAVGDEVLDTVFSKFCLGK